MALCLIVDDSKIVRMLEQRIMERLGFEIAEAEDGQQAMEQCSLRMPDLILLDWYMPVMDGMQFLKQLRATAEGSAPKVIFCTTENEPAQIREALASGADEYVMKPFDAGIITGKLQQMGLIAHEP